MATPNAPPFPPTRRSTGQLEANHAPPTVVQRAETTDSTGGPPRQGLVGRVATGLQSLITPSRPVGKAPGYTSSFKTAILQSWINVLLVFIPISWAAHLAGLSATLTFVFAFLAIVPLASLLSFATEELALRVGQTLGGLLNATLGNVTELIVAILALLKCELRIVQSSLVGSILSNSLLVLGCCLLYGGSRYSEQTVMNTAAQLNASLLQISVLAMLIPAGFHFAYSSTSSTSSVILTEEEEKADVLKMSRGVAVILLVIYLAYLVFQMWSHADLFEDRPSESTRYPEGMSAGLRKANPFKRSGSKSSAASAAGAFVGPDGTVVDKEAVNGGWRQKLHLRKKTTNGGASSEDGDGTVAAVDDATHSDVTSANEVQRVGPAEAEEIVSDEDEEETPSLNFPVTIILMLVSTGLIGYTAEVLVDSIDGLTAANPSLSQEWVGLILLPICGNAAEHVTAVTVAGKDKLDLSMGVAVGSSIQIALFVIPLLVLIGWWAGKPLTMLQDPFETIVLFLSILIVNQTLADGRSNWLEGFLLISVYLMIAVAFWFYPGSEPIIAC